LLLVFATFDQHGGGESLYVCLRFFLLLLLLLNGV
jgi:hypothetical protein